MQASEALSLLLGMEFDTVLDVGSGLGLHANALRKAGKKVTTISLIEPADLIGDYLELDTRGYDCIWASHVLEHQPNPNLFLKKCFNDLNDDGILAITVPPHKPQIVGGHVNFYNAGLLLYHLILAGFDCSKAKVKAYGYNISVIVRKQPAKLEGLHMDRGDIEKLAHYFPMRVWQGFSGDINEVNWHGLNS